MGARLLFGSRVFEDNAHMTLLARSHNEIPWFLINIDFRFNSQVLELEFSVSNFS
jgi:hypothetical protein